MYLKIAHNIIVKECIFHTDHCIAVSLYIYFFMINKDIHRRNATRALEISRPLSVSPLGAIFRRYERVTKSANPIHHLSLFSISILGRGSFETHLNRLTSSVPLKRGGMVLALGMR